MSNFFNNMPVLSSLNRNLAHLPRRDRELFCSFGAGPTCQPAHPTIASAVQHNVQTYPNHTAVTLVTPHGDLDISSSMSYTELDRESNKLAAVLRQHGVTNGDAVCLFLKRSIPMIVGIVATLKVGACYVPQHVGVAPDHQLQLVAAATKACVVLTLSHMVEKLPFFGKGVDVIAVDDVMKISCHQAPVFEGPERSVLPEDRCYIVFTSGTTGKPKGVQVTHGNVANIILTPPMDLGLKPGMKIAQLLSISFDMGAWEILGALSHGSNLLIRHRDIAAAAKHADVIIATPTVLATIDTEGMEHVQAVAVAGEPCPRPLAAKWGSFCTFFNSCGPTEVTIVNTAKAFDASEEVLSIGKPTPNNSVYVLDPETRQPMKIGEVGEMWGGGLCVTAGYLDNERLTDERYVDDLYVTGTTDDSDGKKWKMYRTGDLGRWNERGELEHYGRADDQVKVKGFRVELDGVSAIAERTEGVEKAVVLKVGDGLVAWVTPKDAIKERVKDTVRDGLPYYCIPTKVIAMEELPKTGNGKVDKRALQASLGMQKEGTVMEKERLMTSPLLRKKSSVLDVVEAGTKMERVAATIERLMAWLHLSVHRIVTPIFGHS